MSFKVVNMEMKKDDIVSFLKKSSYNNLKGRELQSIDEKIKNYIKDTDIEERLHKPFVKGKDYDITFFTFREIEEILKSLREKFNGFFITSIENFYRDMIKSRRDGVINKNYIYENFLIEVFDDYDELEYYVSIIHI